MELLDENDQAEASSSITVDDLTGEMVAEERKRRKLSLRKLAKEIGDISANTVDVLNKTLQIEQITTMP